MSDQKNWTSGRQKAAVLCLLAGESLDEVSRELAVTLAQLEGWNQGVLKQIETELKAK